MNTKHNLFLYSSFALTVFLSAFLLFLVQPLIGKYILPWFGGTSFVWITSLLFFQTLLLGGYLYTYLLTKLSAKYQLYIHSLLVLGIAVTTLTLFSVWSSPITPAIEFKIPDTFSPVLQVLSILLLAVGLPYFLLSTTSTLLQNWFSKLPHKKSPYPLYALSNAGSLLAIITYPFFIEPFLSLKNQGFFWSIFFIVLCLLLIVCSMQLLRQKLTIPAKQHKSLQTDLKLLKGSWLFLPALSSLMLLAGTHQLTQGIAPIPFLWLLPLGLYLLSFILCFSERSFYKRNFYAYCFLFSLPIILAQLLQPPVLGLFIEILLFTILLFSTFMLCHGELFANRPEPKNLNIFYLITAFGSVLGAIVVAIIAPLFIIGLSWEFLIGLFLTSLLAGHVLISHKDSYFYRRLQFGSTSQKEMTAFLLIVAFVFYAIISAALYVVQARESKGIWRNFYGILRVNQNKDAMCLMNGKIIHGCQPVDEKYRMKPTTYYGEKSIGLAIQSLREQKPEGLKIGAVGLGVGTVAAYGQKGDTIKFYELNPQDVEIAKKQFTYLSDTPAKVEVITGDGRLSLEKQLQNGQKQNYNILMIDAFTDDAIPVHLLTKEAFGLYRAHLAPDSIVAVHISNSYLDLVPVIAKIAEYYDMHALFIDAPPNNDLQTRSKWAFLSTNRKLLMTQELKKAKSVNADPRDIRLWTDDYSNLFQIFKYYPN
jgi:hypothetical protein